MNHTVVALFIKNKKLLMDKRRSSWKVYANFLMCPSGHIKDGESLEEALKREMKEELGVAIKKSRFLFAIIDTDPFSKLHFQHNFMIIESYDGQIIRSKEAEDLAWLTYSELKKMKLAFLLFFFGI